MCVPPSQPCAEERGERKEQKGEDGKSREPPEGHRQKNRCSLSGPQKEPGVSSSVSSELQPLREVMRVRRVQCDMVCPQPSRGAERS